MRRIAVIAYGLLAYLAFLVPVGYLVGFVGDVWVPKSVDRGAGPSGPALWVDLALLAAFGLQHSVMARPGFKRWLERWVPESLERSTYVLTSGILLGILFWLWHPISPALWDVRGTWLEGAAWAGFAGGWILAVWATFALSHLHLFGLAQVTARAGGSDHPRLGLRTPRLYRLVRHPMTAGMILAFWSVPRMTIGHLVFAAGMTAYCLGATILEERDLLRDFPEGYRAYRRKVPALVPFLRPGLLGPRSGGLGLELSVLIAGLGIFASVLFVRAADAGVREPAVPPSPPDTLVLGGVARTYRMFDAGTGGRPVVLALHGTGGDSERLRGFLGGELDRRAGGRGWVVAYPEAWEGSWNDCRKGVASAARRKGIDDVAFLRALVSRLQRDHGVDPDRVFLLGYSGGGHMAFRVALEAPDLAGGLAVFGANLPTERESVCRIRVESSREGEAPKGPLPEEQSLNGDSLPEGEGPVMEKGHVGRSTPMGSPGGMEIPPMMIVNGTRDPINPDSGGQVVTPDGIRLGPVRSSVETAALFRKIAGHPGRVEFVRLGGGGHVIPGPASRFPAVAGRNVDGYDGILEALDFFQRRTGA